jgi:hypothetical protein
MAMKHLLLSNRFEWEIDPRYLYLCELKCMFLLNKQVLRNVGIFPHHCTAFQRRRPRPESSPLPEPQISHRLVWFSVNFPLYSLFNITSSKSPIYICVCVCVCVYARLPGTFKRDHLSSMLCI